MNDTAQNHAPLLDTFLSGGTGYDASFGLAIGAQPPITNSVPVVKDL